MTGELGATGDIATGLVWSRAIEGAAGDGHEEHGGGLCLNCGTARVGPFCHACGQDGHVHRTLGSIGHDLLHGVFHFEGRVWRTLPMLVRHPGALTRRYIAGERQRFVSPLALFLFVVFLMFAVIHASEGHEEAIPHAQASMSQELAGVDAQIARSQADLARLEATARPGPPGKQLAAARSTVASLKTVRRALAFGSGRSFTFTDARTGWAPLDEGLDRANANPGLALYKLQSSAYKYSWLLIPISTPFVALLFAWRRRYTLYDHAIFVTYSLAFMLMLVTVLSLLLVAHAPGWIFGWLLTLAPPIHMAAQLRGAYRLGWFSTVWRTASLLVFAWTALTVFGALLLAMGLMG